MGHSKVISFRTKIMTSLQGKEHLSNLAQANQITTIIWEQKIKRKATRMLFLQWVTVTLSSKILTQLEMQEWVNMEVFSLALWVHK